MVGALLAVGVEVALLGAEEGGVSTGGDYKRSSIGPRVQVVSSHCGVWENRVGRLANFKVL